jgi:hypothetical protein
MDQHYATHADIERMRADLIEHMGRLAVRLVERMGETAVRLIDRINAAEARLEGRFLAHTRWVLFVGQTLILLAAMLGMAQILR